MGDTYDTENQFNWEMKIVNLSHLPINYTNMFISSLNFSVSQPFALVHCIVIPLNISFMGSTICKF